MWNIRQNVHKNSHYFSFYSRLAVLTVIIILTLVFLFRKNVSYVEHPHFVYLNKLRENQKSDCVVPQIDPWDPSILQYYSKSTPLDCKQLQQRIVKSFENGVITFDKDLVSGMACVKLAISHDEGVTDLDVKYGEPVTFDFNKGHSFPIGDEFFEISCETGVLRRQSFKYHYAQIVRRNSTNIAGKKIKDSSADFPSVIIIGLDSMSRSNFIRQMPKTYKYLMDKKFIDMKSHIKIHDNTYGNLLAILTGKRGVSTDEFKAEVNESWGITFDDFDMVWKHFSDNGYATFLSEDRPDIGTFTYKSLLKGFVFQPTDHYMRPYWICAFWSLIARRSTASCYDNQPQHLIMLDYLEQFIRKYHGKRKFGFWWTQDMSHGFLNLIGRTDEDYLNFLTRNEKYLEDAIVYVLSDHGHRYDKIRETVVGRIESRMPFHSIRIPEVVRKAYPWVVENLQANSLKMTTQFDVHDSLHKIATGAIGQKWDQTTKKRSYSYFDPFPKRLNCLEAGIPSDYCPCFSEIEIPKNEAKEVAEQFMTIVNDVLETSEKPEEYEQDSRELEKFMCSPMEVDSIDFASVRLPMMSVMNDPKSADTPLQSFSLQYHIVVKAKPPSSALLESTMAYNFNTGEWSKFGAIERNNKYGNTSFCVNDRVLKTICHCIPRGHDPITSIL